MTVRALLTQLHSHGITITARGDRVRVEAPAGALSAELRQAIRTHKDKLMDLLETFEERAGIMEFEAQLPRAEAEACAWAYILESLHPDGGPARASTASGSGCDSGKERRYATCVCKQTV